MNKELLRQVVKIIQVCPPNIPEGSEILEKLYTVGNERIFHFAQMIKGIAGYSDLLEQEIDDISYMWYQTYEKVFKSELHLGYEELAIQLRDVLPRIKYAANKFNRAVANAVEAVEKDSIPFEAAQFEGMSLKLLVSLCFYLQEQQQIEGESFWLSGEKAGEACDKSASWGSMMLRELVRKCVLKCTRKGHTGVASEYLYILAPNRNTSEEVQLTYISRKM